MQMTEREKALRAFLMPRPDAVFWIAAAVLVVTLVFMLWLVTDMLGIFYLIFLAVAIRLMAGTVAAAVRFTRAWQRLGAAETEAMLAEFETAEAEAGGALRFGAERLFVRGGGMPLAYGEIRRAYRRGRSRVLCAQRADGRRVTLLRVPADAAGDARAAAVLARLRERNPDMETHPAARPPIFEAKEFDV